MKALQFAIDQQVDIINMSFTTTKDENDPNKQAFEEKVKEAEEKGITVIAAAGNNNGDAAKYIPAGIDGVTTIGAMNKKQYKIESSNYGDVVNFYEIASSTSEACAKYTGKYVSGQDLSGEVTKDNIKIDFTGTEDTPDDKGFTTSGVTVVFEGIATVNLTYASWSGYTITPGQNYTLTAPIPSGYKNSTYNCGGVSISSGGTNINGKTFSTRESSSSAVTRHVACTFAGGTPNSSTYFLNVNLIDPNGNEKTDGSLGTFSYTYSNWGETGKLNVSDCYETGQSQGRLFRVGQLKLKPGLVGKDAYCLTASGTTGVNVYGDGFVMAINGNTTVNINTRWAVLYVNPNGGSWNSSTSTSSVTCSATGQSKSIGNPTRTGYTFTGWSFSGSGSWNGSTYTYGNGDGTLTANWSVNSYYLDLNGNLDGTDNGGLGNYGTADVYINGTKVATGVTDYYTQHPYGTKYKVVVTPAKGHTVNKTTWEGTVGAGYVDVRPSITTNKYTINYKGNGGVWNNQTSWSNTATYGSSYTIEPTFYTRTGYTFAGWTTRSDGKDDGYNWTGWAGTWQYINGDHGISNGTLTLYARWSTNNYSVSINPNGGTYNGTTGVTTKSGKYGSNLEIAEIPTRKGYTFKGWRSSGGGSLHSGVASEKAGEVTMTEKADSDGTAYTKYTMNVQNTGTGYMYPYARFFGYPYTQGHTYRLEFDVRVNSVSGLGYSTIRNAAFINNWEAPSANINYVTNGWVHKTVTRTLTGTTVTQAGTATTIAPMVEWYCSIAAGNTGSFDFDLKNISIYDVTAGTYVSSSYTGVKNSSYVTITDSTANLAAEWEKVTDHNIIYNTNGGTKGTSVSNPNSYKIIDDGIYGIQSSLSGGRYVHVKDANTEKRGTTVLWEGVSLGGGQSCWQFERYSNTPYYYIINRLTGLVMNLPGDGDNVTDNIEMWTQNDGSSSSFQDFLWYLEDAGDGYVYIKNKKTNKALDVADGTDANGTSVRTYTANSSSSQKWKLNLLKQEDGANNYQRRKVSYGANMRVTTVNPVKTGYTFTGWNTKADGTGTKYTAGQEIGYQSADMTLYAQYTINTYTDRISHWAFGFKNKEGNNGDTKNAYFLKTTTFNKTYGGSITYAKSDAITIPNGYTLSSNFGSSSYDGSWKTYPMGTSFTQPAKITDVEFDYFPVNYKITYNLDGGTNASSNPSTYTVLYGVTFANPTKKGYTFAGWYIGNTKVTGINEGANATFSSASDLYTKLSSRTTGDKTLTAKWTPNKYKVTYNANGGKGTMSGDTVTYGSAYKTKMNAYYRNGYTFNGWNSKADGTGTAWSLTGSGTYESGKTWTWSYDYNTTLYAQSRTTV